ncbi:hypothetical protein P5V15_010307 [Pogonomyrmex californicus]
MLCEVARDRIIGMWQLVANLEQICHLILSLCDHRRNNCRPQKTTAEENNNLIRQVHENSFRSVSSVINDLNLLDFTIWLDEKIFCSAVDRLQVWRLDNQRFDSKYVIPHERSGRITCAMWGWISSHGPGELIEVSPHMDAEEYVNILENVLLPTIRSIYPAEDVPIIRLIQDNSAVHSAHIVQE